MNLHTLIEARQADFIDLWRNDTIGDSDDCKRVEKYTQKTIRLILEAQCALLKEMERMESDYDDEDKRARRDVRPYNEALSEIIASNRELLEKIQS